MPKTKLAGILVCFPLLTGLAPAAKNSLSANPGKWLKRDGTSDHECGHEFRTDVPVN